MAADPTEETLRERIQRERVDRAKESLDEKFAAGKFNPINPRQREELQRRMVKSDPPPALQKPPGLAMRVEAGLGGPPIASGKNLNLTVLQFVFLPDSMTGFAIISQDPGYEEIHYWRNGLYVGQEAPEAPGAPAPDDLVEQTIVNLVEAV